jgi:hypothetical protein
MHAAISRHSATWAVEAVLLTPLHVLPVLSTHYKGKSKTSLSAVSKVRPQTTSLLYDPPEDIRSATFALHHYSKPLYGVPIRISSQIVPEGELN